MKPLNYSSDNCDPISSNCVIWQGPDIDCIDLCKGDTVSEVIYKLATELCTLLDKFNITTYDISCFDLNDCAPETFEQLIQLLIDKICLLESGITPSTPTEAGCPDCIVTTCSEFHYQSPQGDTITTMQLKDYVIAIGNKVCDIVGQISTINSTLEQLDNRVTQNEIDINNLQDQTLVLDPITPECVIDPAVPTDPIVVLQALEQQFCNLRQYTGNEQAILTAIQEQCFDLSNSDQLSGVGPMSNITGWNTTVGSLSQSFANLWNTVCDMRSAISFIQDNCCATDCSSVSIIVTGTVISSTQIRLDFSGSVPGTFIDASPSSTIVLTDDAGNGPQTINTVAVLQDYFNPSNPLIIDFSSGINGASDVNISLTLRVEDPAQGLSCESVVQAVALGTTTCPTIIMSVVDYTNATASFTWNSNPTLITAELYDQTGLILQQSQVISVTNGGTFTPSFTSLTENTTYKVRLVINGEPCEFIEFTTLAYTCVGPVLNSVTVDLNNPNGINP